MSTRISEHFIYEDFWANSATAKKYGIDNTPDNSARANMQRLVDRILEPIRKKYGKDIRVNSSYRCEKLNRKVGGSRTSQHKTGEAADIAVRGGSNAELFYCIYNMIQNKEIVVGQLIWEFGTKRNPNWVHVSLPMSSKKNNIVRAFSSGGKTKYIPFDLKENEILTNNTSISDDIFIADNTSLDMNDIEREGGLQIISKRESLSNKRRLTNDYKKK